MSSFHLQTLEKIDSLSIMNIIKPMPEAYIKDMHDEQVICILGYFCFGFNKQSSSFQFVCGYYTINISNVYFMCLEKACEATIMHKRV